jgi:hypothetical protein
MAIAENTNLTIYKGTDFEATFNLFEPDNTTAVLSNLGTTYAKIGKYPTSPTYETFTCDILEDYGAIKLTLDFEQTLRLKIGRNYFDVVLTIDSKKVPVLRGTMMVEDCISTVGIAST